MSDEIAKAAASIGILIVLLAIVRPGFEKVGVGILDGGIAAIIIVLGMAVALAALLKRHKSRKPT